VRLAGVSLLVADFVRTHRAPTGQLSGAVERSWLSNVLLTSAAALFVVLCVHELIGLAG
jgi:hypothetical protein